MGENIFERDKYIFRNSNKFRVVRNSKVLEKEIFFYVRELRLYKVSLGSLADSNIISDMKNLSLNIAYYLAENTVVLEKFIKKRQLPYSDLSKSLRINKIQLEKLNDYIIAYCLLISNENLKNIKEYINISLKQEGLEEISTLEKDIYRGIVLKNNKRHNIVLTAKGDFIRVKKSEQDGLGCEIVGKEKKGLKQYKGKLLLFFVILCILVSVIVYRYNKPESIIRIQATSGVKIEVNSFNKVISVTSETEKGKLLASTVKVEGEKTSDGIIEVLKYIKDNKMFLDSGSGMNIIVIGEPLEESELAKAKEYIRYEEYKVNINNAGKIVEIKPLTKEEREAKKQKEKIIKDKEVEKKEQEDKITTVEKQKK